jgi:hypothetical protein
VLLQISWLRQHWSVLLKGHHHDKLVIFLIDDQDYTTAFHWTGTSEGHVDSRCSRQRAHNVGTTARSEKQAPVACIAAAVARALTGATVASSAIASAPASGGTCNASQHRLQTRHVVPPMIDIAPEVSPAIAAQVSLKVQ